MMQFDGYRDTILFDCGYFFSLRLRDLQRINMIFVSHTHFDHFMGFDHFLRVNMEQDKTVELFGPASFIDQVACKLGGYTWNLCENLKLDFKVNEISEKMQTSTTLIGKEAYKLKDRQISESGEFIKNDEKFTVRSSILDHKTPTLAFSIEEKNTLSVKKEEIDRMGLSPGPWIKDLKNTAIREAEEGKLADEEIIINDKTYNRKYLQDILLEVRKGKKISYVVDTIFNKITAKKIISLVRGSDEFYCEMSYLSSEKDKARENYHLTAKQAAILAKEAEVKKLIPIHFSKRYDKRYDELIKEAEKEFPFIDRGVRYQG